MNFNLLFKNLVQFQNTRTDELSKQETELDVKYQDIIYYMDNGSEVISSKDKIHIDFLKAMSKMDGLDWNYKLNYIGFLNQRTDDCVQYIRQTQKDWYAEMPIKSGKYWYGYTWSCYSDFIPISNMMRLFFEEVSWSGMLSWKMRRFKH